MFMEKVSSLFDLVFVQGTTELDMFDGLVLLNVKPRLPSWLVSMYSLVELLQHAEVGTRRRSNHEIWSFVTDFAPSLALVVFAIEVPTIGQIH